MQKYELSQNGKNYILTTEVQEGNLRLTCVESGILNPPIFYGEFSLTYLRQLSKIFTTISTIEQAQEILNQTIETQKVHIEHKKDIINITLYLQRETESENSASVLMNGMDNQSQNIAYKQPLVYNKVENVTTKTVYTQKPKLAGTHVNISPPIQITHTPKVYTTTTTTTTNDNYQNYGNNVNYDSNHNLTYDNNANYASNQNYENVTYDNNINYENNKNYENATYDNYKNYDNVNVNTETNTYNTTVTSGLEQVTLPLNIENETHTETNLYNTTVTSDLENVALPLNIENETHTETNLYNTTVTSGLENVALPLNVENEAQVETTTNLYNTTVTSGVEGTLPLNINYNNEAHVETNEYNTTVTSGVEEVTLPLNLNEITTTQIETNTYSTTVTPEVQSLTLPLTSITTQNPNQYLNDYQYQTETKTETQTHTQYQPQQPQYFPPQTNEIPYVPPPPVIQPHITYQTVITPPKREQIQYTVPNSKFTYSAVESHNPDVLQQKVVETTKTTTTQQYNPQVQPPQPQIDMTFYNEKITHLQDETNKIRGEYNSLKNEANKLSGEVGQLRSQISILLEENKVLRQKNGSQPSQAQIHEITILKQENERLKKQLEQYINMETTFEQYKRLKEQELNYLKMQIEEYIKNQKKLEEIIALKQREIDELKFQIQHLIKDVNISESQNYIMRQQQKGTGGSQTLTIQDTRMEIVKGDIIKSSAELELLTRKICQDYQKVTLDLLYKATIDSDKASAIHNKCDWANRTLVLIKSGNGRRFGGYTTCNWKGNSIEKKDDNAFVFSLDKMQIYDIIPGELAIGCYPKYGPVFLGCQIRIYDEFFTKGGTTFEKGLNYNTQEDYELTGGLKKFDVKEIEVYSIELQ